MILFLFRTGPAFFLFLYFFCTFYVLCLHMVLFDNIFRGNHRTYFLSYFLRNNLQTNFPFSLSLFLLRVHACVCGLRFEDIFTFFIFDLSLTIFPINMHALLRVQMSIFENVSISEQSFLSFALTRFSPSRFILFSTYIKTTLCRTFTHIRP